VAVWCSDPRAQPLSGPALQRHCNASHLWPRVTAQAQIIFFCSAYDTHIISAFSVIKYSVSQAILAEYKGATLL
jgi:hypothetical protein